MLEGAFVLLSADQISGREKMQIYNGKSVFGGIAIGKISVYQKKEQQVKRVKIDDPESMQWQLQVTITRRCFLQWTTII